MYALMKSPGAASKPDDFGCRSMQVMRKTRLGKRVRPARDLAGLFALVLIAQVVSPQNSFGEGEPSYLYVEIRGDLVTLTARNARVQDALSEIVRQSDLTVVSRAPLDAPVTLEFKEQPLSEALVRIMRGQSYLLHQAKTNNDDGSRTRASDGTLWVFSDETGDETGYRLSSTSMAIGKLRSQLTSDDIRARQEAIKGLRRLKVNEAVEPLSYALGDEERDIRVEAIYALADIGGKDAVAVLASALSDDNAWVRTETAYALGTIGDNSAAPVLKHALYDPDSKVRASAISAFREIGGAALVDALTIVLQDTDPAVRVEAVEAIWNVGGETAIRLLNKALQDKDDTVREAAREGLARLSPRNS
jgi:hypothetical protein